MLGRGFRARVYCNRVCVLFCVVGVVLACLVVDLVWLRGVQRQGKTKMKAHRCAQKSKTETKARNATNTIQRLITMLSYVLPNTLLLRRAIQAHKNLRRIA